MKKTCNLSVILLIFFLISAGLTQTSFDLTNKTTGDTLFTVDNNGRVGIGLRVPEARLDIRTLAAGNWQRGIRLLNPDLEPGNQLMLVMGRSDNVNNAANIYFTYDGDGSVYNRLSLGLYAVNDMINILANNRVGIRTTDPQARLDVNGAFRISAAYTLPAQTNYGLFMTGFPSEATIGKIYVGDNTGWRFHFSSRINSIDTDLMTIQDNGFIGIGVPNPSELLQVNGTVYSSSGGFRFPDGTLQTTAAGSGSGGANTLDQAYDEGGPGAGRIITADAGAVDIQSTGGLRVASNLGIGIPSPLTRLHVRDVGLSLPAGALLNEIITVEDSDAGLGLYSDNGGSYGSVLSMGEIVSGALNNKWSLYRTTSVANPANQLRFSFGSNANYASNPIMWSLSAAGRMGIGTSDPWSGLHLKGDGYPNSFIFLEAGAGMDCGFRLYEGATPQWHIFNTGANHALRIYNSAGTHTVFFADQSTGNVGIGTTTPASNLHVAGSTGLTIDGNLVLGAGSTTDNDYLYFYNSSEALWWNQAQDRFEFSDQVTFLNGIQTGYSGSAILYNQMGTGIPSSSQIASASDLHVSDDLELGGDLYISGTDAADALLSITNGGGSHLIYDDDDRSHTFTIQAAANRWLRFNTNGENQRMVITSAGNVGIGTGTPATRLDVRGNITVRDSASGSITLELGSGLDYAEGFNVSEKDEIEPGTVLCIDPDNPGKLSISALGYDKKVAGIAAGANHLGSGVVLGRGTHDCNVALAGRVYCNVDARNEAIRAGDLLTTSDLPGYAQKVTDYQKAQGAVLGKAMENLDRGKTGQILVLVTLQ